MSSAPISRSMSAMPKGKPERVPALIGELLAAQVDVLVTPGNAATLAAHKATATVPIVYVGDDLTQTGLTAGLARPGGNVTGVDVQSNDYRGKWLELMRAAAPNLRLIAVLWDPDENPAVLGLKEAEPRFGLTLTFLSARPQDLETSLSAIAAGPLQRPDCQRQRHPAAAGAAHRRAGR